MNKDLENFLRDYCNLINWNPTEQQLFNIEKEIKLALGSGKTLSITECQAIVVKYCGKISTFITEGVDNSDLNTLLAMAVKKDTSND